MPEINSEMRNLADYAIRTAKERYNIILDYTDLSIPRLETILEKIYWGFSDHRDEGEGGLVYSAATIWGSYLGEFMKRRWGGKWTLKGTRQVLTIEENDFSPITFIYQKLIGRVRDKVDDYLFEVNRVFPHARTIEPPTVLPPIKEAVLVEHIEDLPIEPDPRINKTKLAIIGVVTGIVIILILLGFGFFRILDRGMPAIGVDPVVSTTRTATQTGTASFTPSPTITTLATYTPEPSATRRPTHTPTATSTATATSSPTLTSTPTVRRTRTPTRTPTQENIFPTFTPVSPTDTPTPTTPPPPPVVIESCSVNPSTIDPGFVVNLNFSAHFSAPGYGFSISLSPEPAGSSTCTAQDDNGDGTADCNGASGMLPSFTTVTVTFTSSVGDCTASYKTSDITP